jgi:trehalose 6-phosphate phosphatase
MIPRTVPCTPMERSAALDPLRADPRQAAVLVDFDGTLSPIVDDPEAARPLEGSPEALGALHAVYGCVAVVSGRPLAFLEAHLPPELELSGLYGLERRRGGVREEHPVAAGWRPVVDEAVARARRELPSEVEVEHKGLSMTLHVRRHPEAAEQARSWADLAAGPLGLHLRPAKMSVELHPPVQVDKGTVVDELVGDLTMACYIGDDAGDLPALDALDRLEARGGTAVRAVVSSPEVDPGMLARADVVVPGPLGVRELLESLL